MPYDLEHEAKACVNELFYRDGPEPKSLRPQDAEYVNEIIECYLRDAFNAGRKPS